MCLCDIDAYGIRIQNGSSVSHVDACQNERFAGASVDFFSAFLGEFWGFGELIGEEHTSRFEPAYEMDIVDMLKLVMVSPHHSLLPNRIGIVSCLCQSLDSSRHFGLRENLRRWWSKIHVTSTTSTLILISDDVGMDD